jgi:hypothetical protein
MEDASHLGLDSTALLMNDLGEPDAVTPPVRFDEEGRSGV